MSAQQFPPRRKRRFLRVIPEPTVSPPKRGKRRLVVKPRPPPPKPAPKVAPSRIVPDLAPMGIQKRQVERAKAVVRVSLEKARAAPPISAQILRFGKKAQEQIFGRRAVQIGQVTRGLTEPFMPTKAAFPVFTAAGVVASVESFVRPDVPTLLSAVTPRGGARLRRIEREFPGFGGGLVLGEFGQAVVLGKAFEKLVSPVAKKVIVSRPVSKIVERLPSRLQPRFFRAAKRLEKIREIEKFFPFEPTARELTIGRALGIPETIIRREAFDIAQSLRRPTVTKAAQIARFSKLFPDIKKETFSVLVKTPTGFVRQVLTPRAPVVSDFFKPRVTRGRPFTPFRAVSRGGQIVISVPKAAVTPVVRPVVPILRGAIRPRAAISVAKVLGVSIPSLIKAKAPPRLRLGEFPSLVKLRKKKRVAPLVVPKALVGVKAKPLLIQVPQALIRPVAVQRQKLSQFAQQVQKLGVTPRTILRPPKVVPRAKPAFPRLKFPKPKKRKKSLEDLFGKRFKLESPLPTGEMLIRVFVGKKKRRKRR